jgi:hypothetical protein
MLTSTLAMTADELHELSGWEVKPEGACKAEQCIPLPASVRRADGRIDVVGFADRLGMPMAHDERHGLWAFGPRAGGKVLESATFPDLVLSDFDGHAYDFAGARGRKVLMIAWASW